jgi:hypothetical protein
MQPETGLLGALGRRGVRKRHSAVDQPPVIELARARESSGAQLLRHVHSRLCEPVFGDQTRHWAEVAIRSE